MILKYWVFDMLTLIYASFGLLIISSLAGFFWGMIWYHPQAFGSLWDASLTHLKQPDDQPKYRKTIIGASLADSLFFSMLAFVLGHSYGTEGWGLLAVSVTVGIFTNTVIKGHALICFLIDAGFLLSQLALIIGIFLLSGMAF